MKQWVCKKCGYFTMETKAAMKHSRWKNHILVLDEIRAPSILAKVISP